jgi:hypothetical protein
VYRIPFTFELALIRFGTVPFAAFVGSRRRQS